MPAPRLCPAPFRSESELIEDGDPGESATGRLVRRRRSSAGSGFDRLVVLSRMASGLGIHSPFSSTSCTDEGTDEGLSSWTGGLGDANVTLDGLAVEGSVSLKLGVEPSGVVSYTSEPEPEDTNVRPELFELDASVELDPDASEGEEMPDKLSSEAEGGYRGLKWSRSNSNSRMMRFCSNAAGVDKPASRFAGAVI